MIKEDNIGRYTINYEQTLGQGGFGLVFRGIQNETKRNVAIKRIQKKYKNVNETLKN